TYHVMLMLQATMKDGSKATEVKEWDFTTEPVIEIGKKKLHESAADYIKRFVSKAPVPRVASFGLDADSYSVDGIGFPMMRKPVIVDGSSYLYIRDLASALGAGVEWDAAQRAAVYTKGKLKVTLYTAKNEIEVNGELRTTDSPARLIGDYTMVPVRLLAEVLGAEVYYAEAAHTVTITY
ncbi:MAG: putative S-layer associated protein, partial [Paenibacillus sp.]|nr:putative S-layer associated protein [Paenibacillus sp.]